MRLLLLAWFLSGMLPIASAFDPVSRGRSVFIYEDCRSCHGTDGEGSKQRQAPNIAGRERWYLEMQLRKFRNGVRGAHQEDDAGKIMAPVSRSLSEQAISDVASYLASLELKSNHTLKKGNVQAGQKLYQNCVACHGAKGEGNNALKAPKLAGLNDWYVVAQLEKFKSGVRGAHAEDREGAMMRPFAMLLEDQEAMENLAYYLRSLE